MKIGDKVEIIETGRIGWILKETVDAWQIDFIDGGRPELVLKNVPMRIVAVEPNPNPNPRPKKRWGWKRWLWTVGIILFLAVAIFITLKNVL